MYGRYRRVGDEEWLDHPPLTATDGNGTEALTTTIRGLFPNRRYQVQFSRWQDYTLFIEVEVLTENFSIPGILDPSLTFDRTVGFWRARLGLADFDLITGELPAGYIQRQHVQTAQTSVAALGRELARRTVGGAFERSDGSWRFVSKSLWPDRDNVGTITQGRFKLVERTLLNELREQLATTEVQFQAYASANANGTTNVYVTSQGDPRKQALYGERALNQRGVFVYLSQIPEAHRENVLRC